MRVRLDPVAVPPELSGADPDALERALHRGRSRALAAIGEDAILQVNEAIHEASPYPPIDTAQLARRESWGYEIDAEATILEVGPVLPIFARALMMEVGRDTGGKAPPLHVIERWVERKGIAARMERLQGLSESGVGAFARGRRVRRRTLTTSRLRRAATVKSLAFVIARSIARKGIRPRNFVQDARPGVEERGRELLAAFTAEALAEIRRPGGAR